MKLGTALTLGIIAITGSNPTPPTSHKVIDADSFTKQTLTHADKKNICIRETPPNTGETNEEITPEHKRKIEDIRHACYSRLRGKKMRDLTVDQKDTLCVDRVLGAIEYVGQFGDLYIECITKNGIYEDILEKHSKSPTSDIADVR